MPLPVDLNLITVVGSYADPSTGAPLEGLVTFYLAQPLTDTVGNVTLAAGPYRAEVVAGTFSITLPCTDNTSLNPTNFAYQVTEQVPGVYRSNTYQLPHTLGATVNIAQLVPVNPSPPYSTVYPVLAQSNVYTGALNDFTGSEVKVATPVNAADAATKAYVDGHGSGAPSGPAGGVLSGTYPNPGATAGLPGTSAVGDTASTGAAGSLALSDHRHGRESFGSVTAQTSFGAASTAGAAATPSHSDHAHGTPSLVDHDALRLGLVGAPFQIESIDHTDLGLTAGILILALIRPGATTVTSLGLFLATAGITASGVNQMALFDEGGTQRAITGDMSAALANVGNNSTYVEAAVTSPFNTADATNYYVGVLCHFSGSDPKIGGAFNASAPVSLPSVKGHRPQIEVSGQAAMPASINVSTATAAPAAYWLVAS